jgi:hypothetical protein
VAVAGLGLACARGEPSDFLAERCIDVLRFRLPPFEELRWRALPAARAVRTLGFEGQFESGPPRVADTVTCVFEDGEPWRLERVAIGDRWLTEGEVALVNSELLLRDLSEHPQRLQRKIDPS